MGQHRLADQIADRPHILHRSAALIVDLDESARHVEGHIFQAPAFRVGPAADGDQHLVGGEVQRLARLSFRWRALRPLPPSKSLRLGAEMHHDAVPLQPFAHRLDQRCVIERQDLVERFDDRHLRTQLAEGDAEFEADIARAHDHQLFRQLHRAPALRSRRSPGRRTAGTAVPPAPSHWPGSHARR